MELRFNKLNGCFLWWIFFKMATLKMKKKGTFCRKYMIFENKIYQIFKNSFVGKTFVTFQHNFQFWGDIWSIL